MKSINPAPEASQHSTISSIEAMRALACIMVVYCHLIGRPLVVWKQESLLLHSLIDRLALAPLGIIQNFGFLGVALFFLISGFIVTHTGLKETRWSFAVKRIYRIYPALFVAVALTVVLANLASAAGWSEGALGIGYTSSLLSALGIDAGFTRKAVLDVGWTITIELFFYAHIFVVLPGLKTRPTLTTLALIVWSVVLVYAGKALAPSFPMPMSGFAQLSAYLPIFTMGMAIYFYWSQRITIKAAAWLAGAAWLALIVNFVRMHPAKVAGPESFPTQIIYAITLLLGALWLYGKFDIKNHAMVRFLADISYSLYLLHLPFGVAVTKLLYPVLGLPAAVALSFVTVVAMAYVTYRMVEVPAQAAGRRLLSGAAGDR